LRSRTGKTPAIQEDRRQKSETKPNCTIVRVAGFSKALRMDLEDVLVRTDDPYQSRQRNWAREDS
jgi:hypothetical protein